VTQTGDSVTVARVARVRVHTSPALFGRLASARGTRLVPPIQQDAVTSRQGRSDLRTTHEAEAARRVVVVETDKRIRPLSVIEVHDGTVHVTVHGQRHLAVAFAGRGGLEFGYPLLKVGAAIAAQIARLSGGDRHAAYETARRGQQGQAASRL